jgi:hypothetical protein
LGDLKSVSASPIWNETVPLADPVWPFVVADKLCVDEGQNQPEAIPEVQVIRALTELLLKNSPFEPLSMKLSL